MAPKQGFKSRPHEAGDLRRTTRVKSQEVPSSGTVRSILLWFYFGLLDQNRSMTSRLEFGIREPVSKRPRGVPPYWTITVVAQRSALTSLEQTALDLLNP